MSAVEIVLVQDRFLVGDIDGNCDTIIRTILQIAASSSDNYVVVFPELALTGYPPEDLLLRPAFTQRVIAATKRIKAAIPATITAIVGLPYQDTAGHLYNSAAIFRPNTIDYYHKRKLPNYGVFDEMRYFKDSSIPYILQIDGLHIGIVICEDIWSNDIIADNVAHGANLLISINASPFHQDKYTQREIWLQSQARKHKTPLLYLNLIGGQDELVFDGGSFVANSEGTITHRAPLFTPFQLHCSFSLQQQRATTTLQQPLLQHGSSIANIYQALITGLRDYVLHNQFEGVVLGLSGGIDSALTLAIAADAIGAENVTAISMPSRYSASISSEDAQEQATTMGVKLLTIPIEEPFQTFLNLLLPHFANAKPDTTEENIQARCRGILVMAMANKYGYMALATGNKSEMAVGYATLYGDMAGGFAPLKDVPKTLVFALANYRNTLSPTIPQRVIDRPPSAELAPDQKDSDSLPDYSILDEIVERFVERNQSIAEIVAAGIKPEDATRVVRLVKINEHKRRQAAPGIKITTKAFGRDRRYPITAKW